MTAGDPLPELPVLDKTDDGVTSTPVVTRREIWSYYWYYNIGGVGPVFSSHLGFATAAGYDPVHGPGSSCLDPHASGKCVVPWGNGTRAVSSVVLLANGISFAVITLILTVFGPASDYGSFGRLPLLVATLIFWGSMFSVMSLTSASRWDAAMAVYIIGFISWGVTVAFYTAIFPRLARSTPRSRELQERYERGEISAKVYIQKASGGVGILIMQSLNLILLSPSRQFQSQQLCHRVVSFHDTGYNIRRQLINNLFEGRPHMGTGWYLVVCVMVSLPCLIRRFRAYYGFDSYIPTAAAGPKLPKGEHYLTIGWKQIWLSLRQCRKLPNTFIYLIAYFLLADSINTMMTLVKICQNLEFSFSFKQNAYLDLVLGSVSTVGVITYWYIQRYWKIDAKKMFVATNVMATLLPLWGMIGIWTKKFGFHNSWEFWAYSAAFGVFQSPYYSFSQTVMAELCPPGFDFMFFGLFGLTNRASSIVGPNIIQAIVNKTGNTWDGFPVLFGMSLLSSLIIWFAVDVPKGRQDARRWAEEQRSTTYARYSDEDEKK
ncbi:autophagy-related protein 22-like protein [Russula compacta]|nr:autophagy-related protein 22-like protein [Russula compacta]